MRQLPTFFSVNKCPQTQLDCLQCQHIFSIQSGLWAEAAVVGPVVSNSDGSSNVSVVIGRAGVAWGFKHVTNPQDIADVPNAHVALPSASGGYAVLCTADGVQPRQVRCHTVATGLHPLRFCGEGVWGTRLAAESIFQRGVGVFESAPGQLAEVVPSTSGAVVPFLPSAPGPLPWGGVRGASGFITLVEAAMHFDVDGDGELSPAEFGAFWNTMLGRTEALALSGSRAFAADTPPDGDWVKGTALKAAQGRAGRAINFDAVPERVTFDDLEDIASEISVPVGPNGGIPLFSLPRVLQWHAENKPKGDITRAWQGTAPGQSLCVEDAVAGAAEPRVMDVATKAEAALLARVTRLVAIKQGSLAATDVGAFDAKADKVPDISKLLRTSAMVMAVAGNPQVQAQAAKVVSAMKQAAATGAPLAEGAVAALGQGLQGAMETAPDVARALQDAMAEAAAKAPALLGAMADSLQEAATVAAKALAAAGKQALAAAVAAGPVLSSVAAQAGAVAAEVGGQAKDQLAQVQACICTGEGERKLRSITAEVGAALEDITGGSEPAEGTAAPVVDAEELSDGEIAAAMGVVLATLQQYMTVDNAQMVARLAAHAAANLAGVLSAGALAGMTAAAEGAQAALAAAMAFAEQVDLAATAAALGTAGAAASDLAVQGAKVAQAHGSAVLRRVLAFAARAGVVVPEEFSRLLGDALTQLKDITPQQVKDIIVPVFDKLSAILPRKLLGEFLGVFQEVAEKVSAAFVSVAGEATEAVKSMPWAEMARVAEAGRGKVLSAASASVGVARSGLATAAAQSGALARVVADSDAAAAVGGAAAAGAAMAEGTAGQMAAAAEQGASVAASAVAAMRAQGPVAIAAARMAAAEMRTQVALALDRAVQGGRAAVAFVSALEAEDVKRALANSPQAAAKVAKAAVAAAQASSVLALAQFNAVRADAAIAASAAAEVAGQLAADVSKEGLAKGAAMAKVAAAAAFKAAAEAYAAAQNAAADAADALGDVAKSDEAKAAAAGATAAAEQVAAVLNEVKEEAGEALAKSAAAVAAGVANGASALRDQGIPMAAAGARATMAAAAAGAAMAEAGLQSALTATMDAMPPQVVEALQRGCAIAAAAGVVALEAVAAAAQVAYQAAIAAGKALAPIVKALVPYGSAVKNAAAATGGAAAAGAVAAAGFVKDASGPVLDSVTQAAGSAGGAMRQGASAAMEGLSTAGTAIGNAADKINIGAAISAVANPLAEGMEAGADFWNGTVVSAAKSVDFGAVTELYSDARGNLTYALAAAAGAAVSLLDLIKIEVIRDFFQFLGLFISNLASGAMESANVVFGRIANIISFDLSFVVPSISPTVIYVIIAIFAIIIIIAYGWALWATSSMQADEIRQGKEAENFDKLIETKKRTITAVKYILTAAFSAYLPVSRSAIQVLRCDSTMGRALKDLGTGITCETVSGAGVLGDREVCKCSEWDQYSVLQVLMVILLLAFTVALPLWTYRLIQKNKPVGSREDPTKRYDEDGELVDYTDAMYQDDLRTDPRQIHSPYLFLYKGYESKWAFFKVFIMVVKLLFATILIVLTESILAQGLATLGLQAAVTAFAFYSTPFLNPQADTMETSGRVTNFFVTLFALIATNDIAPSSSTAMGILINVVNAINAFVMIAASLYGISCVRNKIKTWTGVIHFDDTCKDTSGRFDQVVVSREDNSLQWDLLREAKHRVWHPFWLSLVVNGYGEDVAKRLVELQRIASDVGRKRIVDHFKFAIERGQDRMYVMNEVEGVDAFWDGIPHDGVLDSKTKFGKAVVYSYPFHIVMAYDDDQDFTFVYEDDFLEFVQRNKDAEIMRRKTVRIQLRAAALSGEQMHLEFDRIEKRTVPDGTETYRDSDGNTKTRTVYSTIDVHMFYHNGRVGVGAVDDKPMARGFKATMSYNDGHGRARKPRTGEMAEFTNESTTIGHGELNIDYDFTQQGKLNELLTDQANAPKIAAHVPQWHNTCREYRAKYRVEEAEKEKVLSSAFWLYIYDNVDAGMERLQEYFSVWEQNEEVKSLPQQHAKGLQFVTQRMQFVQSHPCMALWFVFWDSVWENNNELEVVKEAAAILDPKSSDSIAYRPMPKEELVPLLDEAAPGLVGTNACVSQGFLNHGILDGLYIKMGELNKEAEGGKFIWGPGKAYMPSEHPESSSKHKVHGQDVPYTWSAGKGAGAAAAAGALMGGEAEEV